MSPSRYNPREALYRIGVAVGFGVAFAFVVLFIYPRYGLAFTIFIMLVLTVMLVRSFSRTYSYRCGNCGHAFRAPTVVNFLTFSGVGRNPDGTYHTWKSLTCPRCGQRTKAIALKMAPGDTAADPYVSRERGGSQAGRSGKGIARRPPQRRGGRKH